MDQQEGTEIDKVEAEQKEIAGVILSLLGFILALGWIGLHIVRFLAAQVNFLARGG